MEKQPEPRPEFKPVFQLPDGDYVEGTRENSHVFIHEPCDDALNHITLRREKAGMMLSYTIFRHVMPEFDDVASAMIENGYTFTHQSSPSPSTKNAFRNKFVGNIDFIPPPWEPFDDIVVVE